MFYHQIDVFDNEIDYLLYCSIEQEGQPPCQLITPHLEVGGPLNIKPSNGNTHVTINGRPITKKELWVLKVVVLCKITHYQLCVLEHEIKLFC